MHPSDFSGSPQTCGGTMLEWRLQFGTCGGSKDGSRLKIARVPGSFPAVFQLEPSWELPQVPNCSLYSILVAHRSEGHPKSLRGALPGAPPHTTPHCPPKCAPYYPPHMRISPIVCLSSCVPVQICIGHRTPRIH